MVNHEFSDFVNRSEIEKIILQNWSYPPHQTEGIIPILSSIHSRVSIAMARDYPLLDDSYWLAVTGSEKARFEQLRSFEAWAASQPNIRVGLED